MKRIIMALVATIAIGTAAMAQTDEPHRGRHNPQEMAKHRTEQMVTKYGLNDEQAAKLLELNTKYADKLTPMRRHHGPRHDARPDDGEGRRPELTDEQRQQMEAERQAQQKAMEAYETELQTILTEEQFAQYKADSKHQPRHHGRRGPRPPRQ